MTRRKISVKTNGCKITITTISCKLPVTKPTITAAFYRDCDRYFRELVLDEQQTSCIITASNLFDQGIPEVLDALLSTTIDNGDALLAYHLSDESDQEKIDYYEQTIKALQPLADQEYCTDILNRHIMKLFYLKQQI